MSEQDFKASRSILSLLEGETIRIILRDGTVAEGTVRKVTRDELHLGDHSFRLDKIATYYVLKET
jgi:hypothetical protein